MAGTREFEAHPLSAPGDFYVENAQCIACGVPEMVAPALMAHTEDGTHYHCYWKKQPETEEEMKQAFAIFDGQEAGCHRYAGDDPKVQARIGYDSCDAYASNRNSSPFLIATWGAPQVSALLEQPEGEGLFKRLWKRFLERS